MTLSFYKSSELCQGNQMVFRTFWNYSNTIKFLDLALVAVIPAAEKFIVFACYCTIRKTSENECNLQFTNF